MAPKKLLWQLYLSYLFITTITLAAALIFASWAVREIYYDTIVSDLEARARLVEDQVRGLVKTPGADMDALCDRLGKASKTRVTVILPSGKVIGDSEEDPAAMDNHANRPEIKKAYQGEPGQSVRFSNTLNTDMVYFAIPLMVGGEIAAVVRTSVPLTSVGATLREVHARILMSGSIIALVAAALSLWVSRKITSPLVAMKRGAERFSRGELDTRLEVPDSEELGGLAETMNRMAGQLDERIGTITRQRNQQEAILASMAEGVIAVNRVGEIISINQAACSMLGLSVGRALGSLFRDAVPHPEVHVLIERSFTSVEPVEGEVEISREGPLAIQLNAAGLRDSAGDLIGSVLVLNDITRLRRLENVRKEFVANVSHELRTPITSIKGFVETLLDGALQAPGDAERFLAIIQRQVDQLTAIIEDLLLLSRVEQDGDRNAITMKPGSIREVLESAVEVCSFKAMEKDISIGLYARDGVRINMNSALLSQAVINLINNAVNYSEAGASIEVEEYVEKGNVVISVTDHGRGIAPEHRQRLFERFYRVDKARSRKLGGTGLGLAIVKHISQVHGGTVTVESEPGKGSVFSIRLPGPEAKD